MKEEYEVQYNLLVYEKGVTIYVCCVVLCEGDIVVCVKEFESTGGEDSFSHCYVCTCGCGA